MTVLATQIAPSLCGESHHGKLAGDAYFAIAGEAEKPIKPCAVSATPSPALTVSAIFRPRRWRAWRGNRGVHPYL